MLVAKVYILRHGETNENRAHIIQGQLDTLLNEAGRKQAEMAVDLFRDVDLDFALTSDLQRAVETTEIILKDHPKRDSITLVKDKNLRERCFGKLEGLPISAKRAQTGLDETAENIQIFLNRALTWWDTQIVDGLTKAPGKKPHQVLVVSHGGFISALVKNLISSGRVKAEAEITNWICFNVSVTTIEVEENSEARLVRYSDVQHLKVDELVSYNADVVKAAEGLL
ncbi:phosphoglycerate mutase-like protein [Gymnopus androsaceus JB14]|uniref:Phosphoglycerate mutase-like protein n=1 Tax=Gymnopus androsaceus JB14 TaxID=1447944 RepID=A0A6A4HPM9_9AGAR|nr:phosphoglycerate mutase-like protein [Gymnopus androsaceus JB14]